MAKLSMRGKSWYLTWVENGKQRWKSLGQCSKEQAERVLYATEHKLRSGVTVAVPRDTFSVFSLRYLQWYEAELPDSYQRTEGIVNQHLLPVFGKVQLAKITPEMGERYKADRSAQKTYRGKSPAVETINKELRTLHAILNKAVEWGDLQRNPIKSVKQKKKLDSKPHNFFTRDQLEKLYQHDYGDIYRLLANTGMRRAEAFNLKWSDVDDDVIRVLSISESRTKSGKWRQIPISSGCAFALSHLREFAGQRRFVLPRIDKDSLSRAFAKAVRRERLSGSLHDLRHTFISHLVMAGVPLRTVQVLAGHASYRTTEGYAHLAPEHLQEAISHLKL